MNLTDLQELLEERSAEPDGRVMSHLRLDGVRGRIVARRRRRAAAGVAGTAAAVLVLAGLTVALPREDRPAPGGHPTPTVTASPIASIDGFPEYAQGARLMATTVDELPNRTVSLMVAPKDADLVVFIRCDAALVGSVNYTVSVNGSRISRGESCGGTSFTVSVATLAKDYGVKEGEAAEFTMTLHGGQRGSFGLAIGQRVDPATYPYPARPATVEPLELPISNQDGTDSADRGGRMLRSDPDDPNRPVELALTWPGARSLEMRAQTPGALRVLINGQEVAKGEWWDYRQGGYATTGDEQWNTEFRLGLRRGQSVTVTVKPERMSGDWAVLIDPPLPG